MQSMPRRDPGSKRPLPVQREGIEPLRPPERGIRLEQIGQFSLVVLGLLCHLLLFFSLAFPYVYRYDPYVNVTWSTTGWQAVLGDGLLPVVIFPVLPYLACLLPMLRKKEWLEMSLYLNVLLNPVSFLLIWGVLFLDRMGYFDNQTTWQDAAYDRHLAFLLLSAVGSSISSALLGRLLRRNRK